MADVAMVFHWGPSELDPMLLEELADWRERARQRLEPSSSQRPRPSR